MLLVEDNRVNQVVVKKMREKLGFGVDVAANGVQALEQFAQRTHDAILMDCHMPEMDGFQATDAIRAIEKQEGLEPLPVIALTASATTQDRDRCMAAGMNAFVTKPVSATELTKVLAQLIA